MSRLFSVLAGFVISTFLVQPVFAENSSFVYAKEIRQQKIKHPTEAMSMDAHTAILNDMRQKRTDAEKIIVLKNGVKDKGITIEQLITLLNQFLTDDAKIDCAQYAFPYTTNYKSFLKVTDLFQKDSYKFKLEDFYDANEK